jgi:hypothetical protein
MNYGIPSPVFRVPHEYSLPFPSVGGPRRRKGNLQMAAATGSGVFPFPASALFTRLCASSCMQDLTVDASGVWRTQCVVGSWDGAGPSIFLGF